MLETLKFHRKIVKICYNRNNIRDFKARLKHTVRTLLFYKRSKILANFIKKHDFLKNEILRYPTLCSKIHRPYLTNDLTISQKINTILDSYNFLDNFFNDITRTILYKNGEIEICQITGKDDKKFTFFLSLYTNFSREGEFTFKCFNSQNILLSRLTFSIYQNNIIIAGLQGLEKGNEASLIKEATKNLYGIFPKKIILELLYFIFPYHNKIAIGNSKHIYNSLRYRFKKKSKFLANYDEFWESNGGTRNKGIWLLPTVLEKKKIEDIPSKKRSEYKKRYELLDSLLNNTYEFLNSAKRS